MNFHRKLTLMILAGLLACTTVASATPLGLFLDRTERGLTLSHDGKGLEGWGGGPVNLTVNINGPVSFAYLYWAGRERPCTLDASGTTCPATGADQLVNFNGTPLSGTEIGNETQPVSGGGPIRNDGYFADVTSIVAAAGTGSQSFTFADGDPANNFWRFDGVGLIVGYRDTANSTFYRVILFHALDFAYGDDPTPGETRVTTPVTFNHGSSPVSRPAELRIFAGDGTIDRPDNMTISNNPTQFNFLRQANGPEWTAQLVNINIPAGVGTTTVQLNSEPAGQNPDSLLWELAALRVAQLDTTPPTCPARVVAGPPTQLIVTFQDTDSGLASLVVTQSDNADTPVPPFTVGTNDPVTVTATKIDQSRSAHVAITATDVAGNVASCDPIISLVQRSTKSDPIEARVRVTQAENKIQVINSAPGLRTFTALVNGMTFKMSGLRNGEVRTIDVSSAMRPGSKNIIYVKGHGPVNGSATVVISDGSVQ
ncbi:MAG: hypothetical protein ABIS20_10405 [Thermoanaerobaculia bacterium]